MDNVTYSSEHLTNKTVLITGGAKRIGRAIALAFAQAGWNVAVHYAESKDEAMLLLAEIEALGVSALMVNRDLSVEAGVKTLVPEVLAHFGRVDAVINNASRFEFDDIHSFNLAQFDAHMRPNLVAPIILAQSLYDVIPEGEQGVVVNLLDQKLFNYNPDFLSYTLSKAALQAATTILAQVLAPRLRVVGVAPGITLISGKQTDEEFKWAHKQTPLGRSSTPEDVAQTVLFAVNNAALTGTTIVVDGGQHLWPSKRDVMFTTSVDN